MLDKDKDKILDNLESLKDNDLYGTPNIREYELDGKNFRMSPSTIRYIKNSIDIINYFGSDIKTIAEIGGGYGGLCKTMDVFYNFTKYFIFDLPGVNKLSSKYVSMFNMQNKVISDVLDNANIESIDLCISNYAFSELSREVQQKYIDKVIKKSKYFYIIDNHFSSGLYQTPGFTYDELLKELSEFKIETEDEISYGNKIYYGKIKSKK
jgi:putative sugar O-methyltransferase